jgi:xanthine dehydrogenase YagR molybdenum-binding subunit
MMAFKTPKRVKTTVEFEDELIHMDVAVPEFEAPHMPAGVKNRLIGKTATRLIGPEKVTGRAKFTYDMNLPNMLYGKIWRIPVAHAKVKSVDLSKARALSGVHAAIQIAADGDITEYAGQQVAAIAAETEQIAWDACQLVKVDYDELPHAVSMDAARDSSAPQTTGKPNVAERRKRDYWGDVAVGFREADEVIESTYKMECQIHHPLETHGSVAFWEGEKLTVYDSTQSVHGVRSNLAKALNMPAEQVRIICENMGGAFGSKLMLSDFTVVAANLAKQTNRPVKVLMNRKEESLLVGNRDAEEITMKLGAKKDGTLTALEVTYYTNGGNRGGAGPEAAIIDTYKIPNMNITGYDVITNTGPLRPFRAPGRPQGSFAIDGIMDEMAARLGIDPLELRLKNYTTKNKGGTGVAWSSKGLKKAYKQGAKAIEWGQKWQKPGTSEGRYLRGVGMASQIWGGTGGPGNAVDVLLYSTGQVVVQAGTQDIGTGTRTILAMVVAEELGLETTDILVKIGDTDYPKCGGSGGSMTAPSVCPAARSGAMELKQQFLQLIGGHLQVAPENLVIKHGKIAVKGDPAKSIDFVEAARHIGDAPLVAHGERAPNPKGYAINSHGAQFAEVEVDTVTGRVSVVKLVAAHEFGRCINPLTANNQIYGGVIQGIGYALTEQRIMDDNTGTCMNANYRDYRCPAASDIPKIVPIIIDEVDPVLNNLGMKGLGEPPTIPTAGAIANAVSNAIGVRMNSLPLTPDKVLEALEQRKEA